MKASENIAKAAIIIAIFFIAIAIALPMSVYAQQIKHYQPKTVIGYVFLSDGVTNASAGTTVNVSVINESCTAYANISDSNESTTGGGGEPFGAHYYQCTVIAESGDNVTVLAWNDTYTYYGKNDTETLNGGITVNVTMNILKTGDADSDGLNNFKEDYTYRTDRSKKDTDEGGENDGSEVAAGRDPLDPGDDVTEAPPGPSVAVPEYNMIGVLTLIGILSVVLAIETLKRKK